MLKRIDATKLSLLAVGVAAVLFIAVNIVANIWFATARIDLTATGSYTTSAQLRPIFQNVKEPVTVRLYYTEAVGRISPRHGQYYQRVRDLLQQYAGMANGNIKLELYSPEPFSDVEDRAVGFGLQGLPLSQGGEVGYFGLAATNSTDDTEVIPFFAVERERFLEYDLTKLIYNLARPSRPKIGLMTSLPIEGAQGMSEEALQKIQMAGQDLPMPWVVMQQLREFFTIQKLASDIRHIPGDIDTLLLIQPEGLTPQAQLAIDQYVMNGGKALIFVDPSAESQNVVNQLGQADRVKPGSIEGIKKLIEVWGVKLDTKVVGDMDSAIRVNIGVNNRPILSDYVAWIRLEQGHFDPNDAVTGELKTINIATGGALDPVKEAGTTITPLIVTGTRSMRMEADNFISMPDIVTLFRNFVPANKAEVIAARISGTAKSAFPDAADTVKQSKQPVQVIVVADTDMLTDKFWVQVSKVANQDMMVPTADNGNFVSNALENLTGTPALASLRGHGVQSYPFTLLDNIRREAEIQYRATEQNLTGRLEELEQKASAMQVRQDGSGGAVLTDEDKRTIATYRSDILATRRELREVQRALRENIDNLKSTITFANIGGVPIVFGLILIAVAVARHRRRKRRTTDV